MPFKSVFRNSMKQAGFTPLPPCCEDTSDEMNMASSPVSPTTKLLSDHWEDSSSSTLENHKTLNYADRVVPRIYRRLTVIFAALNLLLLLATAGCIGWIIRHMQSEHARGNTPLVVPHFSSGRALNEEINGLVPEFPLRTFKFWNDSRFGPTDHPAEQHENYWKTMHENWETLMPQGRGWIEVEHHEQYILPPPFPGPVPEYGMAVFHQLHCLWLIMITLKELGSGQEPGEDLGHVFHCIDYLRMSIQCCGDTSLEGPDPYHNPIAGTQGIGTTHICKDYDAIFAWAEEHRITDDGTLLDHANETYTVIQVDHDDNVDDDDDDGDAAR